jgi:hypothetical protein
MKPRKWVVVVFACLLAAAAGIVLGVQRLERNRDIERVLVQRLSAATGGEFSVGRVRLGFFSVYLKDVSVSLSIHSFDARVRDIQVAFSLWKLMMTRGDFSRSISKIILISPALDIRLAQLASTGRQPSASGGGTATLLSVFKNFPVRYLLVRRGTVTLWTGKGASMVLGEELSGKVWDEDRAVMMDLRGTLASNRKNLFLSAAFSKTGERNRVSLRLDKARIQRSLGFQAVDITSGMCDGVFEFSFPDSVTAATFESNGWLHVSHGTCAIAGYGAPITSIGLSLVLSNTVMRIDSLSCETKGCALSARGTWDLMDVDSGGSSIVVRAGGIRPEALPGLPASIAKNLSGTAWAEAKVSKRRGESATKFLVTSGGLNLYSFPVTSVECSGSFDSTQVTVDTLAVRGPALRCAASGIATYEKKPVAYSVSFKAALDSVKSVPAMHGQVALAGTVRGLGTTYYVDAVASSGSLRFNGLQLGAPEIHVTTANGKGLSFATLPGNNAYFTATGIVDSLASASPLIACNAAVGPRFLTECIAFANPGFARCVDSAWAAVSFKGTARAFGARGQAGLVLRSAGGLPAIRGGVDIQLDKTESDKAVRWQIAQKGLTISDSLVPVRGQGYLWQDSLRIDSLVALTAFRGAGMIRLNGSSAGADLTVRCVAMPVAALNRLFLKGKLPLSDGTLSGATRIVGGPERVRTDSDLHLRGGTLGAFTAVETDAIIQTRDSIFTVLPLVIRHKGLALISVDTVTNRNGLHFSGSLKEVEASTLLAPLLPEEFRADHEIRGTVSCEFSSAPSGAASVTLYSDMLAIDSWQIDRIRANGIIDGKGIRVRSFSAEDSVRAKVTASGFVPWSMMTESENEGDTLDAQALVSGDLLASLEHNAGVPLYLPVAGSGAGTIEVALRGTRDNMRLTKAAIQIPRGVLRAKPYVPEEIRDLSLRMTLENATAPADSEEDNGFGVASINTVLTGTIGRRPVRIHSTHAVPTGFEPLTLGFLDFGVLLISTPKHGVDVHVPGIMEIGAAGDVELLAKQPFPEFALSGPLDHLCITGTWVMRSTDITFPPLDNVETHVKFDPFPYINWNLDLRAGNRKVTYYYDIGKNRNLIRFIQCDVDPASVLSLRGRVLDNSFKVLGSLRSNTGSVFFARTFDRNVDVGLDFVPQPLGPGKGFDNTPIIWGSAEAMSDTSRFDRIKLTLLVGDSGTGGLSERGRFYDAHLKIGNNIENFPGQSQQQFVNDQGSKYGSVGGAGQLVSSMGEQYLHRMLLQNLERRLAKTLGLDVINVETSIASNYFSKLYMHQFDWNKWDYLTFANVGVTVGRYILYDKVFLKWRTELVPIDTVLRPQYDVGFEFQPLQPILLDVNYGIYKGDKSLEATPTVNLWLQLPIKDLRKLFDF